MGWVIVIALAVTFIAVLVAMSGRDDMERSRAQADFEGLRLSQVAKQTDAGPACPNCGSTSFEAKRSGTGKLLAGVLAPKTRVACVVCGVEFIRG